MSMGSAKDTGWARSTATAAPSRPTAPPAAGSAATTTTAKSVSAKRGRKARLVLSRIDPWSVMKLSFLLSIALAAVAVLAVVLLWGVLDRSGVFESLAGTVSDVTEDADSAGFDLMEYVGFNRVVGVATILACVNVVLMTALATLAAFIYNLVASLVGGLHVTLSEDS